MAVKKKKGICIAVVFGLFIEIGTLLVQLTLS